MPQPLANNRLGVCSWSLHPSGPDDLIAQLHQVDLSTLQLALVPLLDEAAWADAGTKLADAGITLASGMVGTFGEDYSTLESIARTGGLVPDEHWPQNLQRFEQAAKLAQQLKLTRVSFHAGFIPHDPSDPSYDKLSQRLAAVGDLFAQHGSRLLLETGQETAQDLLAFLDQLHHDNLYVNFDPANMILYSKGDPVQAVQTLLPRIDQIHIKDAVHADTPGTWGKEVAVGAGDVDWPGFFAALKAGNYAGDLIIEREAGDQRITDIQQAVRFIRNQV